MINCRTHWLLAPASTPRAHPSTMAVGAAFTSVPVVFSDLSLQEVVQLLPVCVRWRDVLIVQPRYWRNLALSSSSPAAVSFFLARIARAWGRPIIISLSISSLDIPNLGPSCPC